MRRSGGVLVAMLLLAACGRTGRADEARPGPVRLVTTTLPVLATAPSTSEATLPPPASTTATTGTTTPPSPTQPRAGGLRTALPTLADLPPGWRSLPGEEGADDGGGEFCQGYDPFGGRTELEHVGAQFGASATGPYVVALVKRFPADEVAGFLEEVTAAVAACSTSVATGEYGEHDAIRMEPLLFPDLGDGTVAAMVTEKLHADATLTFALAIIVVGERVVFILEGGLDGADVGLTERLARTMVGRL